MKKKQKKATNYISELITTNATLGLQVAYALEAGKTYDQALACARFSMIAFRLDIEAYVRTAIATIGAGLDTEAAFKFTSKVATEAINDYSAALLQHASAAMGENSASRRHQA